MSLAGWTVGLMLADARLPAGGHAYSAGLEPALQAGLDVSEVPDFLRLRLATSMLIDVGTAVVTRHQAGAAGLTELGLVERAWAARTPSPAARRASRDLGRGLYRLSVALWPECAGLSALGDDPPRPLVLGVVAAHVDLCAQDLARLMIYDDVACAVAALLKLEPGDPAEGMRLVLAACAYAEGQLSWVAGITDPEDIPAASAPQAELWIEEHAVSSRRLFRG